MTTNHTPGPWSINNWPQANTDIAIGAIGTPLIAKVPLRDVSINEQKANAILIAASPELLGACRSALRALKDNLAPGCMDADAIAGLEAAIAKATGE